MIKFVPLSAKTTKWSNTLKQQTTDELFDCVLLFLGAGA